uniref:Uncharacterized protein n=1 Tax=Timema genevievae TaxID=629358 RepID=A0A7R9PIN0_TIMGE|nr:unnamed protein product [Timema genevievae]
MSKILTGSDATAVWIIYFHDLAINGSEYMSIDKFDLDVIPSEIAYDFGRVLDGDNNLGEAMNKFLNENSHEIFKYMKPKIMDELGEIFNEIGNQGERHGVASQPTKVSFRTNKNRWITETVDGASYQTGLAGKPYVWK